MARELTHSPYYNTAAGETIICQFSSGFQFSKLCLKSQTDARSAPSYATAVPFPGLKILRRIWGTLTRVDGNYYSLPCKLFIVMRRKHLPA